MAHTARIHKGDVMKELIKELNSIKKYIPYNTFRTIKGHLGVGVGIGFLGSIATVRKHLHV